MYQNTSTSVHRYRWGRQWLVREAWTTMVTWRGEGRCTVRKVATRLLLSSSRILNSRRLAKDSIDRHHQPTCTQAREHACGRCTPTRRQAQSCARSHRHPPRDCDTARTRLPRINTMHQTPTNKMQNTKLDRQQLSYCVSLIENGANPEALAVRLPRRNGMHLLSTDPNRCCDDASTCTDNAAERHPRAAGRIRHRLCRRRR